MPPPIKLLFGPMLIGVFLNTILYGVLVVQTFIYYQTYKRDPSWIRYFVLYLFIAETVNTGCDIGMMYEPLVLKYGTPAAVKYFPLMIAADPIVTVLISTPIQIFIAWRISIISRSMTIPIVISMFALVALGGGIWTGVTVNAVRLFSKKPSLHWPALTWLLASAVADATITISLVWSLTKSKTGFTATDDTLNRIIRLTVQTGLVTALFAAGDVIFFLALPTTTLNFIWDFALSKLYSNALVSTLNARAGWSSIANSHTAHNVLFGDTTGVSTSTSNSRLHVSNTYHNSANSQRVTTGVYELEPQISSFKKIGNDLEYGITATQKVERPEDPLAVLKQLELAEYSSSNSTNNFLNY